MPIQEFQLQELERRVTALEKRTEDVNVLRNKIENLQHDVVELTHKVEGINKALYTAALSVSGGAVLLAFSILQLIR